MTPSTKDDALTAITTVYDPANAKSVSCMVFRKGNCIIGNLYGETANYVYSLIEYYEASQAWEQARYSVEHGIEVSAQDYGDIQNRFTMAQAALSSEALRDTATGEG